MVGNVSRCMPATVEDAELAADLIDHCGGRYG
jgi:hypothetical protein